MSIGNQAPNVAHEQTGVLEKTVTSHAATLSHLDTSFFIIQLFIWCFQKRTIHNNII